MRQHKVAVQIGLTSKTDEHLSRMQNADAAAHSKPGIVDAIFVEPEAVNAVRTINQQLYVFADARHKQV